MASSQVPTQPFTHSSFLLQKYRQKNRRSKPKKTPDSWHKDSLISEAKGKKTILVSRLNVSKSRVMTSQSLSNSHLGSQNPQLLYPCPTAFFAEHNALGYALSLVGSTQLSQLCRLPASCSPSACRWEERESRVGKGGNLGVVQALFSNSQMSVYYQHS